MTTKRETILEQIKVRITALFVGQNLIVTRAMRDGFDIDEQDVIVVHRGVDDPSAAIHTITDHTLEVLISVFTRSEVPERKADTYLEFIHPALCEGAGMDVFDVAPGRTDEPQYGGSDGRVALIKARFYVQYRTAENSLNG